MLLELKQFKNGKGGVTKWSAPSLEEFLAVCKAPVEPSRISEERRSSLDNKTRGSGYRWKWFGGVTLEEACAMFQTGWREGAKSLEELSTYISAPLLRQVEKMVSFDVAPGDWVDPDRFLSGQPEVWGETVESENLVDSTRGKYVHIVVNAGMSCSACDSLNCMLHPVDPKTLQNRGAMICSVVDVMDALGFRVRVSLGLSLEGIFPRTTGTWGQGRSGTEFSCSDYTKNNLALALSVKEYHDPVDMDRLMFMLAHPSMLRRLIFSWMEHLPEEDRIGYQMFCLPEQEVNVTYGNARNTFPKELNLQGEDGDAVVYIPSVVANPAEFKTIEAAKEQCHIILKKQGIKLHFD